jgi:Na+/H+-dicarboxylate symporter
MKMKLHTQIFLGIILGLFCGILFRENAVIFQPIGDMFIRLLRMVVIPIIFSSLVVGVLNLGNVKSLGRLGGRTFVYYLTTTLAAVFIGLLVVNMIHPGWDADIQVTESVLPDGLQNQTLFLSDILKNLVPENIFKAMVEGQTLGLIFFSIIFGCALLAIGKKAEAMGRMVESLNEVVLKITDWIMLLAPIGVFALMASLVGKIGLAAFKPLALYMATVLIGLALHSLFVLSGILVFIGKYSPITFVKRMFPALATAFSTDSSVATLPVTMECLEKNVGISKKVTGFVTPLGATINMDGTALYEAVAAMFIAQVYGIDLTLTQQFIIALTATLASIGAAGIPSAGLITLVIVLKAVNLPLEGIGLLLAVDRILDMCRTTVNVLGDAVGALVVARLEGERPLSQK